jgi:sulfotransferase 6B1
VVQFDALVAMNIVPAIRRRLRPAGKTLQAVARWRRFSFDEAPPIFGNSKPKSGSHLLLQVLAGFTQIMPYAYVASEPVRTITKEGRRRSSPEVVRELRSIPRGVIGWGYIETSPENVALLCTPNRVNYFLYRDPRDMLVSQVYFATDMLEEHGMHAYYKSLPDFGARLSAAITGVDHDGLKMVSVKQRYAGVFDWMQQADVLCIRFEDLMNQRNTTLNAMLDQLEKAGYKIPMPRDRSLAILGEAIQPGKSRTFRSGKTGSWREHFTDEHKHLFKDVAGDLLVRLGYEQSNDW